MPNLDPYDELPYRSVPIEWTAPERLALASLLHGGPRQGLDEYRVLELGCGNGANLLPQAYYRRRAHFVGIDGAGTQIESANSTREQLGLRNVEFIHAEFLEADAQLAGTFDYIVAHGVFSWVPQDVRDGLLRVCARRLRPGGLLYLNYNAKPGWQVRGMVRDFLRAQTAGMSDLRRRAEAARGVAAKLFSSLAETEHAYTRLMAEEFRFVGENELSYIAHEYLAPDNDAFWRSEFMALVGQYGFTYVADADFNYRSGRIPDGFAERLVEERITGCTIEDTVDLLCYRQLHSPILTTGTLLRRPPTPDEYADLFVASSLRPCEPSEQGVPSFQHPSGYRVEARAPEIQHAFTRLQGLWPTGRRLRDLFDDPMLVIDDLQLLYRNGLIELRCVDGLATGIDPDALQSVERSRGGYHTTPYHTREVAA